MGGIRSGRNSCGRRSVEQLQHGFAEWEWVVVRWSLWNDREAPRVGYPKVYLDKQFEAMVAYSYLNCLD
eukprot:2712186-Lingulodinium_polyedra.AAC.1